MRVKQLNTVRHYAKIGTMQSRLKLLGNTPRRADETLLRDAGLKPSVCVIMLLLSLHGLRRRLAENP